MPTVLDDRAGASSEEVAGQGPGGTPSEPEASAVEERHCTNCGAPLEDGQDWCLQCGTPTPGSLDSGRPNWRSLGVVLVLLALLIAGAATAAYAAFKTETATGRRTTVPVAQTPPAATAPPTTPPATTTPPPATPPVGTPTTITPTVPAPATPPKIPTAASTPTPSSSTPSSTTKAPASTPKKTTPASTPTGAQPPAALLLDTNAAATYNPYGYPASRFGDPSLTIDGDRSTAWTAQVEPAVAPRMAEGVVIDLNTAHKLSALELITSTPGMTVQVYGANASSAPSSITSPAWVALSGPKTEPNNRHMHIKLGDATKAFRFVTVWISKAPGASAGSAQAPTRASVNEIELFPAS